MHASCAASLGWGQDRKIPRQSVSSETSRVALTMKATTAEADNTIPLLAYCRLYWAYDTMRWQFTKIFSFGGERPGHFSSVACDILPRVKKVLAIRFAWCRRS